MIYFERRLKIKNVFFSVFFSFFFSVFFLKFFQFFFSYYFFDKCSVFFYSVMDSNFVHGAYGVSQCFLKLNLNTTLDYRTFIKGVIYIQSMTLSIATSSQDRTFIFGYLKLANVFMGIYLTLSTVFSEQLIKNIRKKNTNNIYNFKNLKTFTNNLNVY